MAKTVTIKRGSKDPKTLNQLYEMKQNGESYAVD